MTSANTSKIPLEHLVEIRQSGKETSIGDTASLHTSIEERNDEKSAMMISSMANNDVRLLFYGDRQRGREFSLCDLVSKKMEQTVIVVLDSMIDVRGSTGCIKVDYKILEADGNGKASSDKGFDPECRSPFQAIAMQRNKKLVYHDVMRLLSKKKWKEFGKNQIRKTLLFFVVAWSCLFISVILAVLAPDPAIYNTPEDIFRAFLETFALLYMFRKLIIEIHQLYKRRLEYFKDIFNVIDIVAAILLLTVPILRFSGADAQWHVFSFGFWILTARIFKYAVVNRVTGAYTLIVARVLKYDFPRFGVLFIITLVAFSGTFFLSLRGDNNLSTQNETSTIHGILLVGFRTLSEGESPVTYSGDEGYG